MPGLIRVDPDLPGAAPDEERFRALRAAFCREDEARFNRVALWEEIDLV